MSSVCTWNREITRCLCRTEDQDVQSLEMERADSSNWSTDGRFWGSSLRQSSIKLMSSGENLWLVGTEYLPWVMARLIFAPCSISSFSNGERPKQQQYKRHPKDQISVFSVMFAPVDTSSNSCERYGSVQGS